MLFFKRILGFSESDKAPDRRTGVRYTVGVKFPVKVMLNTRGRDEMGQLLKSKDDQGWDWGGRLLNLSVSGARMQVPATMHSHLGDPCRLKFEIEGYRLAVPGIIAHISERRDSFVYGLQLDTSVDEIRQAYYQLVDLIALGATLKLERPAALDGASGYLAELYAGEGGSKLQVWRDRGSGAMVAFDFRLKQCCVRGLRDRTALEYFVDVNDESIQVAPETQVPEIHRLFHWVVPNVGTAVPIDVRDFLKQFAA
jgi:hypothetical protein